MIFRKLSLLLILLGLVIAGRIGQADGQAEFPIGYVSRGGTYAFINLIAQHKLLEQEGIRPMFVYIGGPRQVQSVRQRTAPISDSLVGLLTKK